MEEKVWRKREADGDSWGKESKISKRGMERGWMGETGMGQNMLY